MIFSLKNLFSLVFILLSVAFFTLLERKILGFSHNRLGPNKISFLGVFQPFSDAMKLFFKDDLKQKEVNYSVYFFSSFIGLFLSIFLWGFFSFWGVIYFSSFSLILLICLIGVGVYFLLFSGWSSMTKYSLLGGYRSSAQSVSYEVVMIFCLLFFIYSLYFLNIFFVGVLICAVSFLFLTIFLFFCWILSVLAECNRSPFDFSEGESELVSGFNTEYSGGLFSFIFISEYSSILFFSSLTSLFFNFSLFMFFFIVYFSFIFLWVRSTFPRLRYDFLMEMTWKGLSIMVLSSFFLLFSFFK